MSGVVSDLQKNKTYFGFWLYLLTDAMMFAALFATFILLRGATNGGPSGKELFDLPFVLTETIILLLSSVTCGIAYVALMKGKKKLFTWFLLSTLLLGELFLGLELYEFRNLVADGHIWSSSAFLSAYFTLVGLHGAHILVGLIWGSIVGLALLRGVMTDTMKRKFGLFALFWHFLEVLPCLQ